jgi:hypothetical protein
LRLTACFITFSRLKLSSEALSTAIRGGQSDDVVVVKFDLRHASAALRFGEERECADVIKADAVPPNSFGTAGVQEDSTGIDLTGNDKDCDLTGGDKEWHPISTAPLEQELEVRLRLGSRLFQSQVHFLIDRKNCMSRIVTLDRRVDESWTRG